MNIDIRGYINENFTNNTKDELKESILESIESKDEEILPGLGVFFELIWENASQDLKNEMIETLRKRVEKGLEN